MTTFKALRRSTELPIAVLAALLAVLAFGVAPAMAEFGLQTLAISARNENGTPDTQAGSHPYALTTSFILNEPVGPAQGDLKDVRLELPPGFVGDPTATPRCSYQEFIKAEKSEPSCSSETAVGVANTYLAEELESAAGEGTPASEVIYNLVPPAGVAAEFGYIVHKEVPVLLATSVRTGGDYGLTTNVREINQAVVVAASKVTIWGVPGAPAHDLIRGACLSSTGMLQKRLGAPGSGLSAGEDEVEGPIGASGSESLLEPTPESEETGGCVSKAPLLPLLTNPTSCNTPRTATLSVDSWEEPGVFRSKSVSLPELLGCEKLDFSPTVSIEPDGSAGSTPTGLNVDLHVPQEASENPVGTAEADVRDTTVTLPAGMQLNPSAADGLQGCPQLHGSAEPSKEAAEERYELSGINLESKQPANCPDASKVANVRIATPLLEHELTGSVYLAAPQNFTGLPENPFSSLVALYLVAEEPERGVLIKLAGHVELGEPGVANGLAPGQIRTSFDDTPQLPFSELQLEFFGTDRAPLATPAFCGTYRPDTTLASWAGAPVVSPSAEFQIASGPVLQIGSGPQAMPCPGSSLPFSPTLESGTTNNNAGSFSNLATTLSREDGQQSIQSITLHYPPGLSGLLSGVKLCGEAEANAGTCGAESQIGETVVSVGLGNDPFSVTGGKVYLTGPYAGAPFGLSIVNPAEAGPFDLQEGRPVVVRAKVEVDPHTAALTVTTDSSGEHAIPTTIDGIPLQIKHVNVDITRPGFTFNPTSCASMKVQGSAVSAEGASAPVSVPFQVANCATLKFAPRFVVSTSGRTSKAGGASLTARLSYPSGSFGTQAEIARVKVDLPRQLPSRLTTLQQACTNAQFEADPAGCPAASKVGYATVTTPLLPVPLSGPAIFVSHGGEAFPSLTMVLQGYGVTIDLVGTTFISKKGITSTTFKTVPDTPFNTFVLTLPEGKYSALAANGDLCKSKLTVPAAFTAQNGAEIHQDTPVTVERCPSSLSFTASIKRQTLKLSVYAPAAGKLTASGKGLTTVRRTAKGREDVTLTLRQKKAGSKKIAVKVVFRPAKGKQQSKTSKLVFKK